MKTRIVAVWLGCAWALGVVGCGKSDADNRSDFISQLCAEFSGCCKAAGRPSDGAQCRAFYGAFAPASGYDQTAAQACLDEVRAKGDLCESSSDSSPSCSKVFASSGTKQLGEACDDDSDCEPAESGRVECVSDYAAGATSQQCQQRLPGKAGSTPCVGTRNGAITFYVGSSDSTPLTGYVCDMADGLSCDSQTGACESLPQVGAACTGTCVSSAYCAFVDGVCKARGALGAGCKDDEECVAGAHCDRTGSTCVASAALGAACDVNADCQSDNCTNEKCAAEDNLTLTFLCGTN